ncbi:MAG TPA: response regulator [Solirubrobacteraceae bacterium]
MTHATGITAAAPAHAVCAADLPLGVVIGSDDPVTRRVFSAALDRVHEIDVLAAASVAEIVELISAKLRPAVVVMDVQLIPVEGLLAIAQVRAASADSQILTFNSPAGAEFGMLCLEAGASGYLSKEVDLESLPRVLLGLVRGEAAISRSFAGELVKQMRPRARPLGRAAPMTPSERRVVERVQAAASLDSVAAELGVSLTTVRRHLVSAKRKLAASAVRS